MIVNGTGFQIIYFKLINFYCMVHNLRDFIFVLFFLGCEETIPNFYDFTLQHFVCLSSYTNRNTVIPFSLQWNIIVLPFLNQGFAVYYISFLLDNLLINLLVKVIHTFKINKMKIYLFMKLNKLSISSRNLPFIRWNSNFNNIALQVYFRFFTNHRQQKYHAIIKT